MNIIDIRLLSCKYSLDSDMPKPSGDAEIEIQCGRHFDEESKVATSRVMVRSASNEKLCSFMVEYGGKFVLDDAEIADQDTFRRLTQVNIPAIIYPYIREHVSDLSRRSGGDPIHLPPVNFVMLAESENRSQIENKEYL